MIGSRPIVVLSDEAIGSPEYKQHLEPWIRESDVVLNSIARNCSPGEFLERALVSVPDDVQRLVVPEADRLLPAFVKAGNVRRRKIQLRYLVMRTPMGSHRDRVVTVLKYGIALLVRLRWRSVRGFFLTDAFGVIERARFASILTAVPDPSPALPVASRETARRYLSISPEAAVYGILGTVTEQKHPELAIEALKRLPDNFVLLFAGQISPGVRRYLDGIDGALHRRILRLDSLLSDEALGMAVSACDVVLLLHDLDGPSGMLVNAAAAGVPVVVGESPWLTRVAECEQLGVSARHEPGTVAMAIALLAQKRPSMGARLGATEAEFAATLLAG